MCFILDGRTRNEEPFVDTSINRRRRKVLARRNLGELRLVDAVGRVGVCDIGKVDITTLLLASNQTLPSIAAFADNLLGILLVLALAAECELVLRLAIWDLVDTEPFVGSSEEARQMTFNVLDVIQLGSEWVVDLLQAMVREREHPDRNTRGLHQ